MMRLFKKSGKALNNAEILRQKYVIYFSAANTMRGILLALAGWIVISIATVTFKNLVINNSIFVTLFVIFTSAFIPLLFISLMQGKQYLKCSKTKWVLCRSLLAALNYYTYFSSRVWITKTSNTLLFSCDTFFVPILIFLIYKKKFPLLVWLGLIVSFTGMTVIYSFKIDVYSFAGIFESLICLFSGLSMAALTIITCFVIRHDPPLRQAMYTAFVGLIISAVGAQVTGWEMPNAIDLFFMITQGLIYALTIFLFVAACRQMEPHIASTMSHCVSIMVVLINGLFLFYPITKNTYIGLVLVAIGIITVLLSTHYQRKEEELLLSN